MNNATPSTLRRLLPAGALLLLGAITAPIRSAETDLPVYTPPLRGAPVVRIGGGSRGEGGGLHLDALAPPHVGRSSVDQPHLYWRISEPPPQGASLKLVVTGLRAPAPLLEQAISLPRQPGLQMIDLAGYGTRLSPEQPYRWSLVLQQDTAATGQENIIVATGLVAYVPLSGGDSAELARGAESSFGRAHFFGRVGYWYDCIDAVASVVIANPTAEPERKAVESLIAQVGKRGSEASPLN